MTGFHKLFMVKIKKLIKNKIGEILLVVYVIYRGVVYTDSKKTVILFTPPTAGFTQYMQLLKGN